MASQIYLDLTYSNVAGNAVQSLYEQTVELTNFRWSMETKEASGQQRNTAAPSVQYKEVTCSKHYDVASPGMMRLLKEGTRMESADLWVEDQFIEKDPAQGDGGAFHSDNTALMITLKNAWISKISLSMSESTSSVSIKEDVTLRYDSITFFYCWSDTPGEKRSRNANFQATVASATTGT